LGDDGGQVCCDLLNILCRKIVSLRLQVVRAALEDNTTLVSVDVRGNKIAKELEASIRSATSNNSLHAQQRLLMKKGSAVTNE
jgi:hypothetical protein